MRHLDFYHSSLVKEYCMDFFAKKISIIGLVIPLLSGCCSDEALDTKSSSSSQNGGMSRLSAAYFGDNNPDILDPPRQLFFEQLNPSVKPIFLSFTEEEQADAIAMSKPLPLKEAVERAANHDAYALPYEQEILFFKLSEKDRVLFLALGMEASELAVKLAKQMNPEQAVLKAAQEEVNKLGLEEQEFFGKLDIEMQTLFLALTPQVRDAAISAGRNGDPNKAVKKVAWMDARRLPKDQQLLYEDLNSHQQTLFLILTPTARSMALQLTKQLNPNTAVQFANRSSAKYFEQAYN